MRPVGELAEAAFESVPPSPSRAPSIRASSQGSAAVPPSAGAEPWDSIIASPSGSALPPMNRYTTSDVAGLHEAAAASDGKPSGKVIILGSGGYGQVTAGLDGGLRLAIKWFRTHNERREQMLPKLAQRSILVGTSIISPYLPKLLGTIHREDDLVVALAWELAPHGTLEDVVRSKQASLPDALRLLADAAEGGAALHKYGFIHRDIKPQNILVWHERKMLLLISPKDTYDPYSCPPPSAGGARTRRQAARHAGRL